MQKRWILKHLILALLLPGTVWAQFYYFGKNKVQYRGFDFTRLETDHFNIYFYSGGEPLAEFAAKVCETQWARLKEDLGQAPGEGAKIPLILYNSPPEFAQTNVILEIIEESVGGFSELFKNRMVIPFTGSYREFQDVLEHELTHIFQFKLFYQDRLSSLLTLTPTFSVPLWVMEGMAEFCSRDWDAENDLFIRDLVLTGRLVPIPKLSDDLGYLLYREGQAIFEFIAERYGRPKVFQFVHSLKLHRSLDRAFEDVFGLSTKEFDERWQDFLKLRYWPLIKLQANFEVVARKLTDHKEDGSTYNTSPVISSSGTKVAFISDRNGYADVYVISAIDGKVLAHLLRGERILGYEAIPLIKGGLAWAPDERSLAVIGQAKGRNMVMLVDYPSGRIRAQCSPNLDWLHSPTFSPQGDRIAFVGVKFGESDIYCWELDSDQIVRLTHDEYEDRNPSFAPDQGIIFVSDRPETGAWRPGEYRVFKLSESRIEALTPALDDCATPVLAPDGVHLYFVGGELSHQLYCYSLEEKKVVGRSDFLGGVGFPSLSRDGQRLGFSYYWEGGWDVCIIRDPLEALPGQIDGEELAGPTELRSYELSGLDRKDLKPYSLNFSPDYAVGTIGYSTGYGASGNLDLAISDVLGNHRIYLSTQLWQDITNSDIFFEYWWLPRRLDIGLSLSQYFNYYWLGGDEYLIQANRGGGWLLSYPFNKFLRLEGGLIGLWVEDTYLVESQGELKLDRRESHIASLVDGALVVDNTLWDRTGPIKGRRARLEGYGEFLGYHFYTGYLDYRRYHQIVPRYILAWRALGIASGGKDREYYYLSAVRGYYYYENFGSKLGILNLELRFPFIDRVEFGFPCRWALTGLRGVGFLDVGCAWDDSLELVDLKSWELKDLKLGIGAGLRFQVLYLPIKFDIAKPLSPTEDKAWKFYIGLGVDF